MTADLQEVWKNRRDYNTAISETFQPAHEPMSFIAGTVSAISWYVPLLLGAIPQFNYVVPAEVISVSYALLLIALNTIIQGAIILLLSGYSFPVISDRFKMNMLRGSFALALGWICVSQFMKIVDYEASVGSRAVSLASEPKVASASIVANLGAASASKEADLELASSRSDDDASPRFETEQSSYTGALKDSAVMAERHNEGKVIERNLPGNSESFASLYGQLMRAPASFVRGREAIFSPLSVSTAPGLEVTVAYLRIRSRLETLNGK